MIRASSSYADYHADEARAVIASPLASYCRLLDAMQVDGIARRDCLAWIYDRHAEEFIAEIVAATTGESELTPQEVRDRWFVNYAAYIINALGWHAVRDMFNLETTQ
jgi:hypothetical protein